MGPRAIAELELEEVPEIEFLSSRRLRANFVQMATYPSFSKICDRLIQKNLAHLPHLDLNIRLWEMTRS